MGFPGALTIRADIRLETATLAFDMTANSTATTSCSFAHNGFFNLDGGPDISGHQVQIEAPSYLPVDAELVPTGEVGSVAGTAFDSRKRRAIGQRGTDHISCLSRYADPIRSVARPHGPESGLTVGVETTEPGLRGYDGICIPHEGLDGLDGRTYGPVAGVALETQAWPDAPDRPAFPSAIQQPGEQYRHQIRYVFSTAEMG